MNLQQLATDLKNKISNQQLTLDNSVIDQDSFAIVLSFFEGKSIFITGLTDPEKQVAVSGNSEEVLTITGNQTLFNLPLSITITLMQQDDDTLKCDYATSFTGIKFSALEGWNILPPEVFKSLGGLSKLFKINMAISSEQVTQNWTAINSENELELLKAIGLSLSEIGFGIQRSPNPLSGDYDISLSLTGTFKLGRTDLKVSVKVPVGTSNPWSVCLSSSTTLAHGIADLTQIVFGNNLMASLPPGFQGALDSHRPAPRQAMGSSKRVYHYQRRSNFYTQQSEFILFPGHQPFWKIFNWKTN